MPFASDAQRRLMYSAASNTSVRKRKKISKTVAEKFIRDSKGQTVKKDG